MSRMTPEYPVSDDPLEIAIRMVELGDSSTAVMILRAVQKERCPKHPYSRVRMGLGQRSEDKARLIFWCCECNDPSALGYGDDEFLCHPV